jgi:ribonuclease HII
MRHYLPHLPGSWEILEEGRDSRYRAGDGRRWGFYVGADHRFLPVALASMVGKYVREILMLAVNRNLGFQDAIPYASGYHHDPRTAVLLEMARRRGWDLERP